MSVRGLVLFDPSGTAHSHNAIQGLVDAAGDLPVTVVSQSEPQVAPGRRVDWHQRATQVVLTTDADRRAFRTALVEAMASTPADSVFCDMGLGRTVQSRGPLVRASSRTVFIGHQSNAIDLHDGAPRRRVSGNRRVLRRLGRDGAQFLAHTERMRRRLVEYVPAEHVRLAGWPVVAANDACLGTDWKPEPEGVTLLFAGAARAGKGLPELTRAIASVSGFDRLLAPGRIGAGIRTDLDLSDPRIEVGDRHLNATEYRETFRRASLVVLPYRRAYVDHGIFSSVLAEALAYGRPLVVSTALAELLPTGYAGAVVAADGPEGLGCALTEALERLPELTAAAMTTGRAHAAAHHTYERYFAAIVDAGAP